MAQQHTTTSGGISGGIEQALRRRAELLTEVESIDAELERVRYALDGGALPASRPVGRPRPTPRGEIRIDGSFANEVMAALAVKEPRTAEDIANWTDITTPWAYQRLVQMVRAGQIFRARLNVQGRTYVYARTEEVLRAFVTAPKRGPASPPEPGANDELGQPIPATSSGDSVVDTSSSATDSLQ